MNSLIFRPNVIYLCACILSINQLLGGDIKLSASDYGTDLVSNEVYVVIKDSSKVKIVAEAQNGTVSMSFVKSEGVTETSNTGAGTSKQTVEFSFSGVCVGKDNWIDINLSHDANDDNGLPCLPNGKRTRFHTYIPKVERITSGWSPDNSSLGQLSTLTGVPQNQLVCGAVIKYNMGGHTWAGRFHEIRTWVAPFVPPDASIAASDLDFEETASISRIYYNGINVEPFLSGSESRPPVKYRPSGQPGADGTSGGFPIRYNDDAPGPDAGAVENNLGWPLNNVDKMIQTTVFIDVPQYKNKAVGKAQTISMTSTCDKIAGTPPTFSWY